MTRAVYTKPLNRKTFHVVVPRMRDADAALMLFWKHYGDHPERVQASASKVMTHGEVREGDLHMLIDYTVRGGHPADLRRWIGRLIWGDAEGGDHVEVTWIKTVRLEGLPVDIAPDS